MMSPTDWLDPEAEEIVGYIPPLDDFCPDCGYLESEHWVRLAGSNLLRCPSEAEVRERWGDR